MESRKITLETGGNSFREHGSSSRIASLESSELARIERHFSREHVSSSQLASIESSELTRIERSVPDRTLERHSSSEHATSSRLAGIESSKLARIELSVPNRTLERSIDRAPNISIHIHTGTGISSKTLLDSNINVSQDRSVTIACFENPNGTARWSSFEESKEIRERLWREDSGDEKIISISDREEPQYGSVSNDRTRLRRSRSLSQREGHYSMDRSRRYRASDTPANYSRRSRSRSRSRRRVVSDDLDFRSYRRSSRERPRRQRSRSASLDRNRPSTSHCQPPDSNRFRRTPPKHTSGCACDQHMARTSTTSRSKEHRSDFRGVFGEHAITLRNANAIRPVRGGAKAGKSVGAVNLPEQSQLDVVKYQGYGQPAMGVHA